MVSYRGRSIGTLAMEFGPLRAACVFVAVTFAPVIALVAVGWIRGAGMLIGLLVAAVMVGVVFSLGAKLARRPHRVKSLLICILLSWSFSSSLGGLQSIFHFDHGLAPNLIVGLLEIAFVFAVAWRLPPRASNSVHV